jgi:hypothetical protein
MNYIKRLEQEGQDASEKRDKALEALRDLQGYLGSEKFRCGDDLDGYVNVQDVLNRLAHIQDALL